MKCTNCDNVIPEGTKFCARCGHQAPGSVDVAPAREMLPGKTRMPMRGRIFVACAVLGPALLLGGIFVNRALLVPGVVIVGAMVLLLILGDLF